MDFLCRYCKTKLETELVDLGLMPLSNDYLEEDKVCMGQFVLPLRVKVCNNCKLAQVVEYQKPTEIFNSDYKYFSSYSSSWLDHSKNYVDMIIDRLKLSEVSKVIEIASNDGYLLQYFLEYGIKPLGIEPATETAKIAKTKGIETINSFFDTNLAKEISQNVGKADLVIGNNVLAHVPDIGNFVEGLKIILDYEGVITMEFPHILNLMKNLQYDTVYHEHYSYLSIITAQRIFGDKGLRIFNVEKLSTHGGSVRIYASHVENKGIEMEDSVKNIIKEETEFGLTNMQTYDDFVERVKNNKFSILEKFINLKKMRKVIVGYGAAAKGNTLLNYCGIGREFITFVADANPNKQNLFLPGSLIPVLSPKQIEVTKPDYIVIFPWNIQDEILEELSYVRDWGGKFLTLIPVLKEI